MGLTSHLKMRLGVEFEKERIDAPATIAAADAFEDLQFSEFGAELIVILAPRRESGAGLGLVAEIEAPSDAEEPTYLFLGPIVEHRSGRWFAAAVPMAVRAFGGEVESGEREDGKWDFAYAAQLAYALTQRWSVAFEGYGTVERIGASGHPSAAALEFGDSDQHRAGVVLYYAHELGGFGRQDAALHVARDDEEEVALTVGIGVLEGLNAHTPDHTVKLSLELEF